MAQSYPDNDKQSGPWRGPRGMTRDEAEDLSQQLKPRWERPAAANGATASSDAAPLNAKKTLVGMNVPDEATTAFEASKTAKSGTASGPRLHATVSGMPAVDPSELDSVSGSGSQRHKQTVMGIPSPVGALADGKPSKATMMGIPIPVEAQKTSKQTNVGMPVPTGIANADLKKKTPDERTMASAQDSSAGETMSDVIAPSTPFPPAADSVPAKPFGATVRAITPPEVLSDLKTEAARPIPTSRPTAPAVTEDDDDLFAAMGAQPGAGKKKAVYAAVVALAAVVLLFVLFSGGDDAEVEAEAKTPAAAPQLADKPTPSKVKPIADAPAPKPDEEKPVVQPAKVVEATPEPPKPTRVTAPAPKATPKPKTTSTPKTTRDDAALRDRKPPRRSSAALPSVGGSGTSKGALLRDPAAKPKTKPKPKAAAPNKSRGTIVRDTPF